jgi:hypothetical protein
VAEVWYEGNYEIPWVSQDCRSFSWLETAPRCGAAKNLSVWSDDVGWRFELPLVDSRSGKRTETKAVVAPPLKLGATAPIFKVTWVSTQRPLAVGAMTQLGLHFEGHDYRIDAEELGDARLEEALQHPQGPLTSHRTCTTASR